MGKFGTCARLLKKYQSVQILKDLDVQWKNTKYFRGYVFEMLIIAQ